LSHPREFVCNVSLIEQSSRTKARQFSVPVSASSRTERIVHELLRSRPNREWVFYSNIIANTLRLLAVYPANLTKAWGKLACLGYNNTQSNTTRTSDEQARSGI
jgi:hypothetical protein